MSKLTYIILSIIIVECFAWSDESYNWDSNYDKIKMENIDSLMFEKNKWTVGKHIKPRPKLMCVDNTYDGICQKL